MHWFYEAQAICLVLPVITLVIKLSELETLAELMSALKETSCHIQMLLFPCITKNQAT